jgi:2-methylcitrate dehydratase PrpD
LTCLYSPFGATAAVARARKMSPEKMSSALALTTAFNAGVTQTWVDGSDEWQIHTGLGGQTALVTNELAAQGVRGGEHMLDGSAGFYHAVVGKDVLFKDIARDFEASPAIEETVIKRYPVSGICQSVVLAAKQIARELAAKGTRA